MDIPNTSTCLGPHTRGGLPSVGELGRGGLVVTDKDTHARLVNFDYNSASLKPEHRSHLDREILPAIRRIGNGARVVLWGHASLVGPEAHNRTLAGKRAEAVRTYLDERLKGSGLQVDFKIYDDRAQVPCDPFSPRGERRPVDRAVTLGVYPPMRITTSSAKRSGQEASAQARRPCLAWPSRRSDATGSLSPKSRSSTISMPGGRSGTADELLTKPWRGIPVAIKPSAHVTCQARERRKSCLER